ncbi:uncharacterized protein JN550_011665 [Neoarthrinium moseri]|uniref:uncharacterized protein n=1 Tax=Neoarthrinium moseri TaxID=1658444 RepID=UPI001FDC781F|nr:uncharacterized protein JN550_011665 [Neoarthrinium moseri]KAI1860287.1 hypothetical protein JN550_011665 [Neoarthrinium moseri]
MGFSKPLATLLVALASLATANSTNCILWNSCNITGPIGSVPGECGKMLVPLDYTNPNSTQRLEIEILRIPATKQPKKGSIFLNFGGPGASGIEDFATFIEEIKAATGGYHDLVNVIPRGTNNTMPFSCYTSQASRYVGEKPLATNASDVALAEVWAQSSIFVSACETLQNDTGRLIGTAFTARDTMQVVEALEEDKMLRYWGFSYGTLLGATLVAMFPDKIDKIVLDGVVNPFEYYQNTESERMASVDDVIRGFASGCVAAPTACPLAQNMTSTQLEESLYISLEQLKQSPIPLPDIATLGGGTLIDYSTFKSYIVSMLDFPQLWPEMAQTLAGLSSPASNPPPARTADAEALWGIKCSDVLTHAGSAIDLLPVIQARRSLSRFEGDATDNLLFRCAQWKMPAKERYSGDWNVKTKNPILIVNNRYDPVTPLVSAKNVSDTFQGSVLLEQVSYGHDSMQQGSLCTAKAIRAYFTNGELPKNGTVCDDLKVKLFSGKTGWDEVIQELNADPVNLG